MNNLAKKFEMNYDDYSAVDLSQMSIGTFKTYTTKDEHNKENKNIANVSISSLGAGILSEANMNMSGNGLLSASFFNPNESFDCDKIKLDVYEKSINKLASENKALRKRVKNLTELARAKEQEIIESLNKACEEKAKVEEFNEIQYNSQLQSYYECFLSIEKENNQLKLKIDQMRGKLIEQQEKLEDLSKEKKDIIEIKTENESFNKTKEDLNIMSMQHINDELSNATKTAEKFVESNKQLAAQDSFDTEYPDHYPCNLNKKEIETMKQRIEELILEKTTLEKKLDSIEKSLQRWIFRACDDKCSLKKAEEKCEKLEQDIITITTSNQQSINDKESAVKMLQLTQIQLEDTKLSLEQAKLLLNDKDYHIDKLTTANKRLESENQEFISKLEYYVNKIYLTTETQTDIQQNTTKTTSSCSKLNELSTLNGHVAKTAAKFKTNQPPTASATQQQQHQVDNTEIKAVKLKNDNLIIEKSQLKFKNDELKFENDELKQKVDDLLKQMNHLKSSLTNPTTKSLNIKTTVSQSVQTIKQAHTSQETQTNQVLNTVSHVNNSSSDLLWRTKFDSIKHELEHSKSESLNETNKLKLNLTSQIETLKQKCQKLELEIQEEKQKLSKLSDLNKEVSAELTTKTTQCNHLEQSVSKMNNDHKKEKQISDTIIQQQKKLLYFLQMKLNPDHQEPLAHLNHLGTKKLFKRNKQNPNPLLANLNKPAVPYQFANNNQTPTTGTLQSITNDTNKKTVKEIEAELNSNYVAYSELSRERKPPTIPVPIPKALQQQSDQRLHSSKQIKDKKIHVFITGLNTCPIYCDVCQHLIPLIAYASKCQLCSFTCHSTCSNLKKSMSSKSKTALAMTANQSIFDPLKYCHMNYLKISQLYNNYINKLSSFVSVSQLDKASSSLLSDYLHILMDNKWKKFWIVLRIDGQLELYQTKTNLKPFETINLVTDRIMFETDYNLVKKLATNSSSGNLSIKHQEEDVNLYEQVDPSQKLALMQEQSIDYAQSSLIILVYNQKLSHQIAFESFSTKSVWLDALQSASLVCNKNMRLSTQVDQFKAFSLGKVLNPFLELSDTAVNSYCVISQKLIALACDDGLYINQIETETSSSNISLIKIDSIESAHKLSYQPEFGKLCLIGKRSRQFLSIDTNELLSKPLIEQQQQQDEIEYEQDEDYPKIVVKIEHIQNIDRCHLFESYLSQNGYWYLAVATPETIFILLFNKTTSKYTLVKTINTQADSPCLCLKFSHLTNQLIYGCSKEFFKLDMTYLQPTPIMDSLNKKSSDDEFSQLIKLQKQPIAICVISLTPATDQSAILLCYEDYALILIFNRTTSNWQVQQQQQQQQQIVTLPLQTASKKTSSSTSLSSNLNNMSCLKWPRGSPPLQIEFNSNNLYLFYNDSICVYKVSYDMNESLFMFKKSGVAFIYKPRYLSSFQQDKESYLTISNRRPVINTTTTQLNDMNENRQYYDYEANENDYNDDDMLVDEDEVKSSSNKILGLDQDDNDRICLSYFCCP